MMGTNIDKYHKAWYMIHKYISKQKMIYKQYNINICHSGSSKLDYHEINMAIRHLKPGQIVVVRFYDYNNADYAEDAYVAIKAYEHRGYHRFSMKVFYMNNKENVIHPMMLECVSHSYELRFNDESIKYGMSWIIRNAVMNVLYMCYTHIYDYCMFPIVVINDKKPQRMNDEIDRFIDNIQSNYKSSHSYAFMVESVPNAAVTITVCPSYANITVHDKGVVINYPLFPVPVERKRILSSHPQPIFKLVNMILTKAYKSGLYRRRLKNQYALDKTIQGPGHSRYNVKSNPETKEVAFTDYTEENLAKMFTERIQEVAAPFWSNMFRYEYAFHTHDENSVGYTMKIGALMLKDYAMVYAYEMRDGHNRAVSICSKIVSPIVSNVHDGFTSDYINEQHNAMNSGVNTELIATAIAEYAREWLGEARRANKK